nr:amino acid permease [Planctomycetota bacterium]
MPDTIAPSAVQPSTARFGTFGGVFTPCTLTILGVIMFLRFGQVVGNAGIWQALIIVSIAKLITSLTALSLSAIATNTRVKGGGAYYLISRSLGIEFGGAIGLVFYLSQAISVAMYVIGFTEALMATWPDLGDFTTIASLVNLGVFICVFIGAGWTIKVQYVILAVLIVSICSFVVGAAGAFSTETFATNWQPEFTDKQSFFTMFALFFPAATGIMAGANMSGDLKDPAKSIPRGTLWAILVTGLVYAGFAILLGGAGVRSMLQEDTMSVQHLAWWGPAITAGVFAATLSSALGSLMGAPRILQALARDRVFPILNPFAAGSGASGEPRRATVLSFLIAQAGVMLGDLNAIAPIITMFFMITYGALNAATFVEAYARNPSWRPRFRWSHWISALLGALLCVAAMVLIDPLWAIGSTVTMVVVHRYLKRKDLRATWGDVNSGAAFERARRNLLQLEQERYHPKNWRPAVLAMGVGKDGRQRLAVFARWIAGRHGLLLTGQVLVGTGDDHIERHQRHQKLLRKLSTEQNLDAFPAVVTGTSLSGGVSSLVQCCGIGALRPNLVLLGWSRETDKRVEYLRCLRVAERLGRSVGIMRLNEGERAPTDPWIVPRGPIDVWWLGQSNGELMLLLAHLLRQNQGWRSRGIRLRRMLSAEAGKATAVGHLRELCAAARIDADVDVIIGDNFAETVARRSRHAALTI